MLFPMFSRRRFVELLAVELSAAILAVTAIGAPPASARSVSRGPHTPPGMGYLCTWPGDSAFHDDFLTFSTKGSTLSGQVSQADLTVVATVPMTGTVHGNDVTFLPLSGFGRYQGIVSGTAFSLTAANGDSPNITIDCSLVTDAKWRQTIPMMGLGNRVRGLSDSVAVYDLLIAGPSFGGVADWVGTRLAFGHVAWHIHRSTGPVSAVHYVSISQQPYFRVEATRSATGRCWYEFQNDGTSASNGGIAGLAAVPAGQASLYASPQGAVWSSCSAKPVGTPLEPQQ